MRIIIINIFNWNIFTRYKTTYKIYYINETDPSENVLRS